MPMPSTLHAGAIELRRYRESDGPALATAVRESGADLSRYETWAHGAFTDDEGRSHVAWWAQAWDRGTAFYYGVWSNGVLLGSAGLSGVEHTHRTASLGYWVRASATGGGVATAAAGEVVTAGLTHLGLQRIEIMAAAGNGASRRVAEKVGATLEGILRKRQVLDGVATDCALYAVVT